MTNFSRPRKRLGQHFLHDPQVIEQIIAAIAPTPTQHLVEIGAGRGALTIPLWQRDSWLDVIEFDRELATYLAQHSALSSRSRIFQADALRFDFGQLATAEQPLRIVGNLPYNIATPLLFHLLEYAKTIQDMTFMLQKEVVARIVASPATKAYGRLSIMLQYRCQVEHLFDVGREAFRPPPQVMSSVVRLMPYTVLPVTVANFADFTEVVAYAFAQRRKVLSNSLKPLLDSRAIESAAVDPQARAETLALADFVELANVLTGIKLKAII